MSGTTDIAKGRVEEAAGVLSGNENGGGRVTPHSTQ